jgi:hypothetical protein
MLPPATSVHAARAVPAHRTLIIASSSRAAPAPRTVTKHSGVTNYPSIYLSICLSIAIDTVDTVTVVGIISTVINN